MGNVFYRFNSCADIEIIEYSRESGCGFDDDNKLVDHLEFVELDLDEYEVVQDFFILNKEIMDGTRISERRVIFHNMEVEEMCNRHWRCQLALVEMLERDSVFLSSSSEFMEEFDNFRFACVPKLNSLRQVYDVNSEIAWQAIVCECADITLFKIPRLVNDLEGYVKMLYRKHLQEL